MALGRTLRMTLALFPLCAAAACVSDPGPPALNGRPAGAASLTAGAPAPAAGGAAGPLSVLWNAVSTGAGAFALLGFLLGMDISWCAPARPAQADAARSAPCSKRHTHACGDRRGWPPGRSRCRQGPSFGRNAAVTRSTFAGVTCQRAASSYSNSALTLRVTRLNWNSILMKPLSCRGRSHSR